MEYHSKLLFSEFVTPDVKRFIIEKPEGFRYKTGQATRIAINLPGWNTKFQPFTPTAIPDALILEYYIKVYPSHHGVTEQLHEHLPGTELIIQEPFKTGIYEPHAVYIAGGAGITPFLANFRYFALNGTLSETTLLYSNKTETDIIQERELQFLFSSHRNDLVLTLTREVKTDFESGRITKEFLKKHIPDFQKPFHLCGPDPFVSDISIALSELGAENDSVIIE